MAGDWIKMRTDLFTHPKVVRISSALKADTLRTVGGLLSVWSLFDAHSVDGIVDGYTTETLDDHLRWPGFAAAMIAVGWLSESAGSLVLPEFEAHNGASAKRRAQDADRKKAVRKMSASEADKKRTREEKRREENTTTSSTHVDQCPVGKIITLFAEQAPSLVQPRIVTDAVKAQISARWRESEKHQSLDFWLDFFAYCETSDFLAGRTDGRGGKPFRAGLEWVVKAGNFAKIINGNYHSEAAA